MSLMTTQSLGLKGYQPEMTVPQVPPAGIKTGYAESAADALRWQERPPTPTEIKKYRQSTIHEPGVTLKHPGLADDVFPDGPHGDKTGAIHTGRNVQESICTYPDSEIARWKLEQSEAVYARNKREPLGQGYQRGHQLPEGLGTQRAFGMIVDAKGKEEARQARTVVFPVDQEPQDESQAHDLYLRSHAAYAPGEQRSRNYNWQAPGVDPKDFRFGATEKHPYHEGVRKALQPGLDQSLQTNPTVVSKVYDEFKATAADYLGKPKMLGAGDRPQLRSDHTFGLPSLKNGRREAGVAELISTGVPPEYQGPDADLGKSLREGFRNTPKPGDDTRAFGVPSIRTDLAIPKVRSVANAKNFGNEPDCFQLLRPPRSAELGISDEHYVHMRSRAEVQELVQEAGIHLDDGDFDRLFAMASEADGEPAAEASNGGRCSLDTFFRARSHLLAQTLTIPPPF